MGYRIAGIDVHKKQRHVSRCRKRSSGWRKACKSVARLHRRVFHQRNDFQHKWSRELVNHYGFIAVEDLNVKGLASGRLAKSAHDAAGSSVIAKLSYKAESADRLLVKVDARGTSQQCPCGAPAPKKLWDRKHHGTVCGLNTTRDHASALEILAGGLRLRTAMPAIAGMALDLEAPAFRRGA
jgi:putative transposase